MTILVLGLGNELLADDAAGILAVRQLRHELDGQADIVESSLAGLALLDVLVGYDRAIIIDAIQTGRVPAGTIQELTPKDLDHVTCPSPHYAGLPEILDLATRLRLRFPAEIRIIAIEVSDTVSIGGKMSESVQSAVADVVREAKSQVEAWSTAPAP